MGREGDTEHDHAAVRMLEGCNIHAEPQPLDQAGLGACQVGEGLAADDVPGTLIGDTQDHRPAALICKRYAILDQFLEVAAIPRLFQFHVSSSPALNQA